MAEIDIMFTHGFYNISKQIPVNMENIIDEDFGLCLSNCMFKLTEVTNYLINYLAFP